MDTVIGTVFLFLSLSLLIYITLWSRKIIKFIGENDHKTAREILKAWHERK
jgi:hypothetical protein